MNDIKATDVMGVLSPLRRYARSLARDEHVAEDLVQDTLVRAYEGRSSFRSGNLRGWLLSILHNTFLDGRRRHMAEARRLEQAAVLAETTAPAEQEAVSGFSKSRPRSLAFPTSSAPLCTSWRSKACPTRRPLLPWAFPSAP